MIVTVVIRFSARWVVGGGGRVISTCTEFRLNRYYSPCCFLMMITFSNKYGVNLYIELIRMSCLFQDFEVEVSCRVAEIKRTVVDTFDLDGLNEYGLCFGLKDRGSSIFKPSVCSHFFLSFLISFDQKSKYLLQIYNKKFCLRQISDCGFLL